MKKNFFKKLSFVMALAMIISVIAPAAGAFAATGAYLNSTKKFLYLNEEGKPSDFDFNIKNKPAGSASYTWTSDNTDVATVESPSGVVTAQDKGTAKITVVIKDKAGKKLKTLYARVYVRDNIETIKISNYTDKTVIKVNDTFDFNRTFTTFAGSTTATSSITRYAVDNNGVIDATTGKFTPAAAGEYNVTAYAFASTYEYTKWLADKADSWVLVKDTVKVVVSPSVVSTKQVDTDTVAVTFDSDMSKSDFATTAVLYQILNDKEITTGAEKISKVTYDETGKVATIDILAPFTSGVTYKLVSRDLVASFKAASTDVANVTSIAFDDFTVNVNGSAASMLSSVKGLNADGVVIKTGADVDFAGLLGFKYDGDLTKGFVSGTDCYLYTVGYTSTVTATYTNWVYDDVQKKYVEVKATDSAVATGVQTDNSLRTGSISFVLKPIAGDGVVTADTKGWNTTFSVPAGDPEFVIHYKYQTNDITDGHFIYAEDAGLTFKTDNPDKLLVFGTHMVAIAQGSATVLVLKDGKTVTAFTVNITPARTFVSATSDVAGVSLGNSTTAGVVEDRTFTITGKDSQNDTVDPTIESVEIVNAPAAVTDKVAALANFNIEQDDAAVDKSTLKISGSDDVAGAAVKGAYTFLVTVSADVNGVGLADTKQVRLSVIVLDATDVTVTRWSAELSKSTVELKDLVANEQISADVYGYNAAGARVVLVPNTDFEIAVQNNGAAFTTGVDTVAATLDVVTGAPGNLSLYAKGTYVVTYKALDTDPVAAGGQNAFNKAAGMVVGYATLTVTDASTTTSAVKVSSVSEAAHGTIADAALTAFEFKLNDSVITADADHVFTFFTSDGQHVVTGTDGTGDVNANSTLYVDHVVVRVTVAVGVTRDYTIDVKKTIAILP